MIPTKKNRLFVLAAAGMIIPATFLFSVVASIPHVFIIVCVGLAVSLLLRTPIKYSDRTIIYSIVLSLVLVVLLDLVFPVKGDHFLYVGRLLLAHITVPLMLYLAVCATFYESTAYTLGFSAAFSLLALLFGGDARTNVYSDKMVPQVFFSHLLTVSAFQTFFLLTASLVVIVILISFYLLRKSSFHRSTHHVDWFKRLLYSVATIVVVLMTLGALSAVNSLDSELRSLEELFMSVARYPDLINSPNIVFSNKIDLNTTIKADRKKNKRLLMLRVVSPGSSPGYLRGKSYQHYAKGVWSVTEEEKRVQCKAKTNIDKLAISAFFIDKDPGVDGKTVTIYPSAKCLSDFLFLPGNTERIDMVADRLMHNSDGVFYPFMWESDAGYTARVPEVKQYAAYQEPKIFSESDYLNYPPELNKTLDSLSEEIFTWQDDKITTSLSSENKLSDRQKIARIIDYFNAEFSYSLQPEIPPDGEEPLKFFISKTRKGHCELFASSAAMLLRKLGIPCRYITGFVCHSEHPSGQYYVVRLGDAHAWVEAYLRSEKRWVLVDATPASGDDSSPQWGFFESWYDRLKYSLSKILADVRRGYIARAVLTAFIELFSFLWTPLGAVLLLLLTFLLIWKYRFAKHRKQAMTLLQLDRERRELQKLMQKVTRRVGKQSNIMRTSQMSLEEWLKIMRNSQIMDAEKLAALERLINDYNQLRFSTSPIPSEKLMEWKKRAAEC